MKRFLTAPLFLILLAASGPQPTVETAGGDWTQLPAMRFRGYDHLQPKVMAYLYQIAYRRQCTIPGYSVGKLDLNLPFAAQFSPDGGLQRVILPKLNCPAAEGALGGALIDMIQAGDYRPTGENPDGWYQSKLAFDFED